MTKALFDGVRASERPLHGHLLVEQHSDEQRGSVALKQLVSGRYSGDVQSFGSGGHGYKYRLSVQRAHAFRVQTIFLDCLLDCRCRDRASKRQLVQH